MSRYAHLAFTELVRRFQESQGSARANARRRARDTGPDPLTSAESRFIAEQDGFYLGTVGETGWPYVQHRGGPAGFVHVLDERTLAFLDVRGNRQYVTGGNLSASDKVALFFMDYAFQRRLKLLGRAVLRPLEDAGLLEAVSEPRTSGRAERIVVITVEGYEWNCSQHITPRFTTEELSAGLSAMRGEIRRLQLENEDLRQRITPGSDAPDGGSIPR